MLTLFTIRLREKTIKTFAIIGVAGYIAKKHLQAIKDTGNVLVASMDKSDSVGLLESFFPESEFFTEIERFERHLAKLQDLDKGVDYLVVCTPNYLHDSHIRLGLNLGMDVICEKPLVVNPLNLDLVKKAEKKNNKKVNAILQLRLHPNVNKIRELSKSIGKRSCDEVEIQYVAPRGKWYEYSWKADDEKSGGLIYNIGIHFLDLICWLYGDIYKTEVTRWDKFTIEGNTLFANAKVKWLLSTVGSPKRIFVVNNEVIDFTGGFDDLHTKSYREILSGNGFDIDDAYWGINLAHSIKAGDLTYEHFCLRK